jgi:hypothetical protein
MVPLGRFGSLAPGTSAMASGRQMVSPLQIDIQQVVCQLGREWGTFRKPLELAVYRLNRIHSLFPYGTDLARLAKGQ